jgi:hypothetical protein
MAKITYNGITTSIESGKTATLPCSGKRMKSDIVVEVDETSTTIDSPLPIEVSTEAEMTALLNTAEVGSIYKYVGTSGTYESGALYVVEEDGVALISFTIEGTTYQAEDGMTWEEWVESEYNTGEYTTKYNKVYTNNNSYRVVALRKPESSGGYTDWQCSTTEVIVNDGYYVTILLDQGGSN